MNLKKEINKKEIESLIPHRDPFLLIDKLINIEPMVSATGIMNITKDKFFFNGHFPEQPVMPGVLVVEAFGQSAAALTAYSLDPSIVKNKLVYLMTIQNARFRNPIFPGCELKLNITALKSKGRIWKYKGVAMVENKIMADSEWMATIVDRKNNDK
jgi:3-hydroxyacyl-[acyl-carrier-protein] dehydratase